MYHNNPYAVVKYSKEVGTLKNTHVKTALYHWIIQHTHVFQSPIYNYLLKVYIDCHSEKNMVPKLLLQVYAQELNNIMVSPS